MTKKFISKKELAKQGNATTWIRKGFIAYPNGIPPQSHPEAEWWWTGWRMKEANLQMDTKKFIPVKPDEEMQRMLTAIPKPPKKYHRKEAGILKKCLPLLAHHKIFAWRNSVGTFQLGTGRYIQFGAAGMSDIIGILPTGRFLAIEVKRPGNYQTPAQKSFEAKVKRSNGIYWLVRSVDELEQHIKEYLAMFLKGIK